LVIIGLNGLVVVLLTAATLILLFGQRRAVNHQHDTAAQQTQVTIRALTADVVNQLAAAGQSGTAESLADAAALRGVMIHPALRSISLVDADGKEIAHTPPTPDRTAPNFAEHPAWIALTSGETEGQPASVLIESDPPVLAVAVAVGGGPVSLVADLDPQMLWAGALAPGAADEGYVYLLTSGGERLAVDLQVEIDEQRRPAEFAIFEAARDGDPQTRLYRGLSGDWVIGHAEAIPGGTMLIFVETPLSALAGPLIALIVLWLAGLVLTALLGEWLVRRTLRTVIGPLDLLAAGARSVTAGDYRYRVRVLPQLDRELGDLLRAFNGMVEQLDNSQRQIDAYTHQMQEIVDQRARELSRKATQLEVAAEVSSKIATILDPRKLADEVVDLIQARFKVYHAEIVLVDENTSQLVPSRAHTRSNFPPLALNDANRSVLAWVARKGETLYVPDVTEEPRFIKSPELPASRSELAIPLKFGSRVIGVLNLEADHRDAFPKDETAVLESLANEIAVSLHNAQVFDALEKANRDLAQATMLANQSNMLKSRFLFNASHKLRTPLNAITGYAETILSGMYGELSDTLLDRQQRILENGRQLQALIEDMLDLSSIETGQMQLNFQWLPLPPLLTEAMNAARALRQVAYADHKLDLRLDLPGNLPPVWVDVERLRYILINLLSNAVKYSESGEVVLSAEADEREVRLRVRDTGPGISEDERRYLFEPFQHQKGSVGAEGKGTGLGLPVSRLLAMRHGGDLTVESQLHQGSTFILHLPRQPEGAPPPPETPQPSGGSDAA
jgi:signal transduction histidine kinase